MSTNFQDQLHKHVLVVFFVYYYCDSCYFCFKAYYCKLVQELYESYKKKYEEIQKAIKPIELVNYKQGDYIAIEYELFKFAIHREAIDMPRDRACVLLMKIGCMFLVFVLIFQVIPTPVSVYIVFGVLVLMLKITDTYINDTTESFKLLESNADPIVDDFIDKKK